MREDSDVDFLFAGIVVVLYGEAFVSAFRRGPDDPSWETRWRSLDSTGRERIADASYSNSRLSGLADPEETQLAKGYRRRLNRRSAYRGLAVFPFLVILAALTLGGVFAFTVFALTFTAAAYGINLPISRRVKAAKRRARPATAEPEAVH
jgi:hypothetical protein